MEYAEIFYPESRFGGFSDIDGTMIFYSRVNALLNPSSVVLDVGCGRGAYGENPVPYVRNLRILKGKVSKVIGIDVDPEAACNPYVDEFRLLQQERWPLENHSVDLVLCDNVLEHIADPGVMFMEVRRILKSGGYLCIRTPNAWNYIAFFSKIIPQRLHARVLAKVQPGRKAEDVFPAYYRCNTIWKLRGMMDKFGFEHAIYGYEAAPSYLSFSKFAYWLGVMHQRFAPGFLKPAIFAFGRLRKEPLP